MNGKLLWSHAATPAATRFGWGTGSSPVLHQNRIYIVNDNDAHSYIEALDKKTGEQIWKVDRDEGTNWATPYIWEHDIDEKHDGRDRDVGNGSRAVLRSGRQAFVGIRRDVVDRDPDPVREPRAVVRDLGLRWRSDPAGVCHQAGGARRYNARQGRDQQRRNRVVPAAEGPYNPSPIVYGDYYYVLLDRGFLTCHDARTGKEIYGKQRMDPQAGAFTASPWASNGKLFILSEDGDTFVVAAGSDYKLLGKNSLDEMTMATPVIVRGSLVIRTASKLYRIGKK